MTEGITRLRELLLDKEQRDITAIAKRVEAVAAQAVAKDTLQASVAGVLSDSIREVEAETRTRTELASAVAPVIIDTVRTEVRKSANDLADALHPHMGRMISAYVASAIKDMMAKMNRSLESGLSLRRWLLRLRSWFSGRSEAELLLLDLNTLRVQELYLVRRGSGELIEHWEAVGAGEVAGTAVDIPGDDVSGERLRSNRDAVMSAFLSAMSDFAREAFSTGEGGLRNFDVNNGRVYVRSSPGYLLAARCTGVPTPATESVLDTVFEGTIERHRNLLSAKLNGQRPAELRHLLPGLAQHMQQEIDSGAQEAGGGSTSLAKWFVVLLVTGLIGWLAWDRYMTWRTDTTRAQVEAVLASSIMGSYVSRVEVDRGGYVVRLRGLAPSETDKSAVLGNLEKLLESTKIEDRIEILPERGDGGLQSFKRDVQESSASATLAAMQRALSRARLRVQHITAELDRLTREGATRLPVMETAARRVSAAASELDALTQTVAAARPSDDLSGLQPRLDGVSTLVRQTAAGMAELRGERPGPAPARAQTGSERHAGVREEAELIANAADALWTEVAATERFLLRRTVDELSRRPLPAPTVQLATKTPRQELDEWTRLNAVFFSADAAYRDAEATARLLDALVVLLRRADGLVRIVGYTDDLGSAQRNTGIAYERAVRVRQDLVDRGVPATRVTAVGRPNGPSLSQTTGLNSPNRRVEFELGFDREGG